MNGLLFVMEKEMSGIFMMEVQKEHLECKNRFMRLTFPARANPSGVFIFLPFSPSIICISQIFVVPLHSNLHKLVRD